MDKKELLKKVKLLEIKSKKHLHQLLAGAYHSVFKSKGIEFFDVKEYRFGDDIKDIDWNVTARSENTYVRNYVEERELQLIIAIDVSGSQHFGSHTQVKKDLAVELGALLAFSALSNKDKVGLFLFSNQLEKFIPPKKGRKHILRLVRDLIHHQVKSAQTDICFALTFLQKIIKKKAILFFISDFIDQNNYVKPLTILGQKHDVIAIKISDPFEELPPKVGFIRLGDNETGEEQVVNLNQKGFHKTYQHFVFEKNKKLNLIFKTANIDFLHFKTNIPYITQLTHFFKKRAQRY